MNPKKSRPNQLSGHTYQTNTGCGKLYITINEHDGEPFELFATMGKAGGCACAQIEAIGRLVSLGLRSGVKIDQFIRQMQGISCHSALTTGDDKTLSCADAIAKALKQRVEMATVNPEITIELDGKDVRLEELELKEWQPSEEFMELVNNSIKPYK